MQSELQHNAYSFERGYPDADTARLAYDAADLARAVQAYRFFFPTVSGMALVKSNTAIGLVDNRVFGVLETQLHHLILTSNVDTPYGPIPLNLSAGRSGGPLDPDHSWARLVYLLPHLRTGGGRV